METTDLAGWLAAALTFGTLACRDVVRLRVFAVLANLAFIAYAGSVGLWPVLVLHLALLPLNLRRLLEQGPLLQPALRVPGRR
ncbi:MAG: hypothetical protein ACK5YM_17705 [Pseudomonadota bacterium]